MESENKIIEQPIIEVKKEAISKTKEYEKDYNKEYYKKNRAKALAYMSTKIDCTACNCKISRGKRSHHLKSAKHIKNARIQELEAQVNAK
jgi:hypothetical protein